MFLFKILSGKKWSRVNWNKWAGKKGRKYAIHAHAHNSKYWNVVNKQIKNTETRINIEYQANEAKLRSDSCFVYFHSNQLANETRKLFAASLCGILSLPVNTSHACKSTRTSFEALSTSKFVYFTANIGTMYTFFCNILRLGLAFFACWDVYF